MIITIYLFPTIHIVIKYKYEEDTYMTLKSFISKCTVKNSLKGVLLVALIGSSALMCTQFVIANDLSAMSQVPANYNTSEFAYLTHRQLPTSYVKADYKMTYAAHTRSKTPDAKDLSMQEAAEVAAQEIFRLSSQGLEGKTLEMAYYPKTSDSNSKWLISVAITPSYQFSLAINGNTGELLNIRRAGSPNVAQDFDINSSAANTLIKTQLANNSKQIEAHLNDAYEKVKNLIAEKAYLPDAIKSIAYESTSCDAFAVPSYTFNITTTTDKTYTISCSTDFTELIDCFIKQN